MLNRNYDPKPKFFNIGIEPVIGRNCSLVNTLFDCMDRIVIEENVSFGHNCMVLTGYHDVSLKGAERMAFIPHKPVTILQGAWIASGVIICPGVVIGENSVIGAGAVVVRDVPANEFWAGSPAEFKKRI